MNYSTIRAKTFISILADESVKVERSAKILDFGCGNGDLVYALRNDGYDAYGCDLTYKDGDYVSTLEESGYINRIIPSPYKLPFDDNTFDIVLSDQVLEHVADLSTALAEIHRVLKSDGSSLHIFPSKYKFIEPHVRVPLATILQGYWWLRIWAELGVRKDTQTDMTPHDVASSNHEYLINSTCYRTKSNLIDLSLRLFSDVSFCELTFLKHSTRGRIAYNLSFIFPFLPRIYSCFFSRVMLMRAR